MGTSLISKVENSIKSFSEMLNNRKTAQSAVSDLKKVLQSWNSKRDLGVMSRNKGSKGYFYHPAAVQYATERLHEVASSKVNNEQKVTTKISKSWEQRK